MSFASAGLPGIVVLVEGQPEWRLDLADCLTIGRSSDNSLALSDPKVSRRHAEIRMIATGRYRLSDLGSGNGTWLNGQRLMVPRDLQNGDVIQIGATRLRFEAAMPLAETEDTEKSGTATQMAKESVIVLVADIRNYTSMTEVLPPEGFSRFIKDWFRESMSIIQSRGGIVDKFIGDAVMCFWRIPMPENPAPEVKMALETTAALMQAAERFSQRLSDMFPGHTFRIGAGISMGNALLGNVGTPENQSITILGDSVNVAFRLESLTRQFQVAAIASSNLVPWAGQEFKFESLGDTEVKGRSKPVSIFALIAD